jgi:hypothetical protein
MKPLVVFAVLCLTLVLASPASRGGDELKEGQHPYRLSFQGTAGVRVRLLLVSKPTDKETPQRREEIITLPADIDLNAARCYAWIDSLPESGQPGDQCSVQLLIDGKPSSQVEWTYKADAKQSGGLGDL